MLTVIYKWQLTSSFERFSFLLPESFVCLFICVQNIWFFVSLAIFLWGACSLGFYAYLWGKLTHQVEAKKAHSLIPDVVKLPTLEVFLGKRNGESVRNFVNLVETYFQLTGVRDETTQA